MIEAERWVLVPSETLIPAIASILIIMIASLAVVGIILKAMNTLVDVVKTLSFNAEKSVSRIKITNTTLTNVNTSSTLVNITLKIYLYNDGNLPLYDFNSSDLIIQYLDANNNTVVKRLNYKTHWYIKEIILTENYTVSFSEKPIIDEGETAVIYAWFTMDYTDYVSLSSPIRIVFSSQYGTTTAAWVDIRA